MLKPFSLMILAALMLPGAPAPAREPTLSDLDTLTGRWISLRGTLAEEKRLWRNRKAAWEEEIALLEQQSEALGAELDTTREVLSTAEQRRADALARREEAESELGNADAVMDAAMRRIRRFASLIPVPLRAQLPTELQSLLEADAGNLPRAQRAQRMVAFLSTLESMQNRYHAVQQTLETDSGRRQVEVLYIGLARGFAVSPGNDWAAVGVPGETGWIWTPDAVEPAKVRKLLDVYHRRETADLASVPLQVEDAP
jgi:hypothetical protein